MDRGSYDELTLARNRADFDALRFRQRVLVDVSKQNLATTILGRAAKLPLVLAPTGMAGFVRGNGEILAARAAEASGVPFCLSTVSVCSIEDVRAATSAPFWFQLYVLRDRGYTSELVERAAAAGCPVLMMTVDIPVGALRRRDAKNGLTVPPRLKLRNALDIATRPGWVWSLLTAKRREFGNLTAAVSRARGVHFSQWVQSQVDPSLTWDDLARVREQWKGKLIVKGILDRTMRAASSTWCRRADRVQPRRTPAGRRTLIHLRIAAVVQAVQGRCEVLLDSGIRSGQDILKAVALGATATLAGRAWLYGLGALGQQGVALALEIMSRELAVSLALTGCSDVRAADRALLVD